MCAKFHDNRSTTLPQATAERLPLLGMQASDVTMEVYTYAFNGRRSQTRLNIVAKFGKFVALTETRRITLF
ncbi:hypothetical protein DPMN_061986 [Dreissena polymorpha]|uniref:Uncharacterized protein n=1 Tax=Dreissena polymorpha TaxID=45954 RepID=A0A9D4C8P9_DREPO|nr:hypothetical protein DPMN_061986 [Dreissena polymorpha]